MKYPTDENTVPPKMALVLAVSLVLWGMALVTTIVATGVYLLVS